METIPYSERAKDIKDLDLSFDDLPIERALGIQWCVESDSFQFRLQLKEQTMTRRGILSTVASVYDPLGFLAPFVLTGKQILQEMCKQGAGWDDPLTGELQSRWERWREDLPGLASVKISRGYQPENFGKVVKYELHHFSDASSTGYGQCSYLRLINQKGNVHCALIMGKARVTPLRVFTIPRLELQAAIVSVKVSKFLQQELEYKEISEFFWTDSKVVLGYIGNDAKRFHVYVANRVQKIRDATEPHQWNYVPSERNPADHASRGLDAKGMLKSNWFDGPSFLWERRLPIEVTQVGELIPNDPEVKHANVYATTVQEEMSLLSRILHFSDWNRAVNGIAVLQQLIERRRHPGEVNTSDLIAKEKPKTLIVKMIQCESFAEEITLLQGKTPGEIIKKRSRLYKLDPFIDDNGVVRVGGRLTYASSLHYDIKHPIILPAKSHVTQLVIKHCHEKVEHQGRGMTVNEIRSRVYWVISISSAVSSHIYKCVQCRKLRVQTQGQKMANQPKERLQPSAPFSYCGYDCFGPIYVKDGRKELNRYGLIFTCMSSRAVHIEMLDNMTTDAFINGLRCFIAIRGAVRQLRSDQGTNFVGAINEMAKGLEEIDDERVRNYLKDNGCEMVMNVSGSSHMGGVWERQIRTVKNVLVALTKHANSRLDSSSLRTFFYEVMAIVNSRPLTVDNLNDPCGPEAMTPNHLLTMKSKILMPFPGKFESEDIYARKRWRRVQYLADQFWTRWKKEYLSNLQIRQKWNKTHRNVQIGDIVLLKDEDLVRCQWKLAKVVQTMPSQDNLVRKVRLLMADDTLTNKGKRVKAASYLDRPIHKLAILVAHRD